MLTLKHLHCTYFIAIFLLFHIMFHQPEYCCKWQVTRRKEIHLPYCRVPFREEKVRVCRVALHMSNHLSAFRKTWNHLPGKGRKAGADDHGDQQGEHGYATQRGWKWEGRDMMWHESWFLLVKYELLIVKFCKFLLSEVILFGFSNGVGKKHLCPQETVWKKSSYWLPCSDWDASGGHCFGRWSVHEHSNPQQDSKTTFFANRRLLTWCGTHDRQRNLTCQDSVRITSPCIFTFGEIRQIRSVGIDTFKAPTHHLVFPQVLLKQTPNRKNYV